MADITKNETKYENTNIESTNKSMTCGVGRLYIDTPSLLSLPLSLCCFFPHSLTLTRLVIKGYFEAFRNETKFRNETNKAPPRSEPTAGAPSGRRGGVQCGF